MRLVPDVETQEWLLEHLKRILAEGACDAFLSAPVLAPTVECFPDPWEPSERGVHVMLCRLLRHAGLGALDVRVSSDELPLDEEYGHGETAAWFAGIEDGVAWFGVHPELLGDRLSLAGVLAHETAHAWRRHHAVEDEDRTLEELLTDLSTVALGFGVLTLNACDIFRSSGDLRGAYAVQHYSRAQAGYLPSDAMAFALAAQLLARGVEPAARKALVRHLERNQAECLKAALAELGPRRDQLEGRLALPPRSLWPPARSIEAVPPRERLRLEDARVEFSAVEEREALHRDAERARLVFRMRDHGGVPGLIAGMVLGAALLVAFPIHPVMLCVPALIGPYLGYRVGRRFHDFRCSDSACRQRVLDDTERCPACQRIFRGTLDSEEERWDAERRLGRIDEPEGWDRTGDTDDPGA